MIRQCHHCKTWNNLARRDECRTCYARLHRSDAAHTSPVPQPPPDTRLFIGGPADGLRLAVPDGFTRYMYRTPDEPMVRDAGNPAPTGGTGDTVYAMVQMSNGAFVFAPEDMRHGTMVDLLLEHYRP